MTLTNDQAVQYFHQLRTVPPCTGKLGWAIYRNLKTLSNALEEYNKMHDELVKKYSSDGRTVDSDKIPAFSKELEPLLNLSQDIAIYEIDEKDLYSDNLTAQDYMKIDFMLKQA